MNSKKNRPTLLPALSLAIAGAALLTTACIADETGSPMPAAAGDAGQGVGGSTVGVAGANTRGGEPTAENGGAPVAAAGGNAGGDPQEPSTSEGGVGGVAGVGGEGGSATVDPVGGSAGEGGTTQAPACTFHTAAAVSMAAGGEGGAGPAPTITLQTSPFVGSYLADGAGRTLFVYGNDLPGDCQQDNAPTSRCVADCVVSWPIFDAGARVLGPGLSDEAFGTIQRSDGLSQTTYHGWPLYYYKSDLTLGQLTGQGKGKTWHVAETVPASIVIMKEGTLKYLADSAGHALYVSAADTLGDAAHDPVSSCDRECLATFASFHQRNPSVVGSLEQADFSVFVRRGAGGLQLAFRGQPLYRSRNDVKAGDMTGLAVAGFSVAQP